MGVKSPPAQYVWAVSGGLLASSCCMLQLVFNAFSVGCAGDHLCWGPYVELAPDTGTFIQPSLLLVVHPWLSLLFPISQNTGTKVNHTISSEGVRSQESLAHSEKPLQGLHSLLTYT